MKHKRMQYGSGFTLIEMMAVIFIIGLLAVMVVPKFFGQTDKAVVTKIKQDIRAIESAAKLYRLDHFQYPSTQDGLAALAGQYIERLPQDPWGKDYLYRIPGQNGAIDIYTLGKDGKTGGSDLDTDIGNWQLK